MKELLLLFSNERDLYIFAFIVSVFLDDDSFFLLIFDALWFNRLMREKIETKWNNDL